MTGPRAFVAFTFPEVEALPAICKFSVVISTDPSPVPIVEAVSTGTFLGSFPNGQMVTRFTRSCFWGASAVLAFPGFAMMMMVALPAFIKNAVIPGTDSWRETEFA